MGDLAQHRPVIHQYLGRQPVDIVCARAHVQELAFAVGYVAPLEDHSRHVLGNHREPIAGEPALLLSELVLGDIELDAVQAQRLAVFAALENSARSEYPAPLTVLAAQPMVSAEQSGPPFHDILDRLVGAGAIVRVA